MPTNCDLYLLIIFCVVLFGLNLINFKTNSSLFNISSDSSMKLFYGFSGDDDLEYKQPKNITTITNKTKSPIPSSPPPQINNKPKQIPVIHNQKTLPTKPPVIIKTKQKVVPKKINLLSSNHDHHNQSKNTSYKGAVNILYTDKSIPYPKETFTKLTIPFGIVYLQWSKKRYLKGRLIELMRSVSSLRQNASGGKQVPILLFTSPNLWKDIQMNSLWTQDCFNLVLNVNSIFSSSIIYHHFHLKPKIMLHSPFQISLFLDSDTAWCKGDLDLLGNIGKEVDFAAVITPYYGRNPLVIGIPKSFPSLNSGFFLVNTQRQFGRQLLQDWEASYSKNFKIMHKNQPSLRHALWDNYNRSLGKPNSFKIFYLSSNWNCRGRRSCVASPSCFVLHTHGIKNMWGEARKARKRGPIIERMSWDVLNDKWGTWPSMFKKQAVIPRNLSVLPQGYD